MMQNQHGGPSPQYHFFTDHEVILYLEHVKDWLTSDPNNISATQLFAWLKEHNVPTELLDDIQVETTPLGIRFMLPDGSPLPQLTLFTLQIRSGNVVEFIQLFNESFSKNDFKDFGSVRLYQALPNWLMGASAHNGIGTHGPGRPPRPILHAPHKLPGLKFGFTQAFANTLTRAKSRPDVDVYILDTVPSPCRIHSAWAEWGQSTLEPFRRILELQGTFLPRMNIYNTEQAAYIYASAMNQNLEQAIAELENDPEHLWLRDQLKDALHIPQDHLFNYDLSDHGLFVASIVHQIAPEAKLFVLQILNEYGVGTFSTIGAGFDTISRLRQPSHMTIINCSFTLAFITPDHTSVSMSPNAAKLAALGAGMSSSLVDGASVLFAKMASCVVSANEILVAAAGNDSDRANTVPKPARYPARLSYVIGVGALKKDGTFAPYSNKADTPNDGVMAFGGDYAEQAATNSEGDYVDSGDGVIGVFTGDFMDAPNENGFAEWAGTSFAAPAISGAIAQLCLTEGKNPNQAKGVIRGNPPAGAPEAPKFMGIEQKVGLYKQQVKQIALVFRSQPQGRYLRLANLL